MIVLHLIIELDRIRWLIIRKLLRNQNIINLEERLNKKLNKSLNKKRKKKQKRAKMLGNKFQILKAQF